MGEVAIVRGLALGFVLLALPAAASAASIHRPDRFDPDLVMHDQPRLQLGNAVMGTAAGNRVTDNPIFDLEPRAEDGIPSPGLSFGGIHAESEIVNGRRHVHYRIDGLTLMGGQIGASVSRRGAMLTLHWGN